MHGLLPSDMLAVEFKALYARLVDVTPRHTLSDLMMFRECTAYARLWLAAHHYPPMPDHRIRRIMRDAGIPGYDVLSLHDTPEYPNKNT